MARRGADNLASVSALAARELRPGDPVLFLPSHRAALGAGVPEGVPRVRDMALASPAPASGTLYGRGGPAHCGGNWTGSTRCGWSRSRTRLSPAWIRAARPSGSSGPWSRRSSCPGSRSGAAG